MSSVYKAEGLFLTSHVLELLSVRGSCMRSGKSITVSGLEEVVQVSKMVCQKELKYNTNSE